MPLHSELYIAVPEATPPVEFDPVLAKECESLASLAGTRNPQLQQAVDALAQGDEEGAERLLRAFLAEHADEPDGLHLMGEVCLRSGRKEAAEQILSKCVAQFPDVERYRCSYAYSLAAAEKYDSALLQMEVLARRSPHRLVYELGRAGFLRTSGRELELRQCCAKLTENFPDSVSVWVAYANALRSAGRQDECVKVLRKAIGMAPRYGRLYWMLASLRTYRFDDTDRERMEALLAERQLGHEERAHLHFALAKAYDDAENYAKAFEHLSRANALRRLDIEYDPEVTSDGVRRFRGFFTREFFERRGDCGCQSDEVIFVLGMQRAGSTLVEQILGSHSAIEPAGELGDLLKIVREDLLSGREDDYPRVLDDLSANELRKLGQKYMESTLGRRPLGRRYFVDKCPYNFWHVGLIRLILPRAKIIDARRHPLGCCLGNFMVSFEGSVPIAFRQSDIGRFYVDYVKLMAHFDEVLPGAVHRVHYERLVEDLEAEVRRMLSFVGVPFEPACLEFYKNDRPLQSFSSEQVRRPIFKHAVDHWRHYDRWLGPLKTALGSTLDAYPRVPIFTD